MALKNLKVNVSFKKTIKTKLYLFIAKPMILIGFWDIEKAANVIAESFLVEVGDIE